MKTSVLTLGLLTILPLAASAAERLSYNYVEGDYVRTDFKNIDGYNAPTADGFGIKGSYAFSPNFHFYGLLNRQDFPHNYYAGTFNEWQAGIGYNRELNSTTDFLVRAAYFDFNKSLSGHGISVESGVRKYFNQSFEGYVLGGLQNYLSKDSLNGRFFLRFGGQVKINQNWGIAADMKFGGGDFDQFTIGPRLTW